MFVRIIQRTTIGMALLLLVVFAVEARDNPVNKPKESSIIGRWDITVSSADGNYPSWLEVKRSGIRALVGSYVGRFGSARPISHVTFDKGQFSFTIPPQWERCPWDSETPQRV